MRPDIANLAQIDTTAALDVVSAASDVAMVVDQQGVIRDVRIGSSQIPTEVTETWVGKAWLDVVTSESRVKVEEMLAEVQAQDLPNRWRHVNYPAAQGPDMPVLCSAILVGPLGHIIVFGRDLRNMASLQQRLVEAHQAMERDYLRMRHMETRYRLLFELAAEAVLIVDANSQRILEANPAASKILGQQVKRLIGKPLHEFMPEASREVIEDLLMGVRSSNRPDVRTIKLAKDRGEIAISASLFRQESGTMFLIRLMPTAVTAQPEGLPPKRSLMLDVLEHAPDGFVVTESSGKILTANRAFVDMLELSKEEQVQGRNLADWLGRTNVDLSVLIANIQQRGAVRLFGTLLRCANAAELQVEISGVSVKSGTTTCLGFSIRDVGQRLSAERPSLQQLPRSADQLVELVGRVPLQEIVAETADLIEKLCIEAALRLTRDNRASAAEMLGLSRQSLYVKLRRYGIGEVTDRGKK
ncbi:MAG: transcriptional regulator PpsR [Burkholderiaceae bacterium]|nr:transcriptional regulator PpsR [Burkholderiaceae bacterium]